MKPIVILCTTDSMENAKTIAHALLDDKLASCANIIPNINSVYRWKNEVVEDNEILILIKTKAKLFNEVKERILLLHPYETAEIISVEIKDGSKDYLRWIETETI